MPELTLTLPPQAPSFWFVEARKPGVLTRHRFRSRDEAELCAEALREARYKVTIEEVPCD